MATIDPPEGQLMQLKPGAISGRCHCGNLEIRFESSVPLKQLPIRACACLFCRAHGARTTSDPNGRVEIGIKDPGDLIRYRFGLRTADFLICARCGIYVAAVLTAMDSSFATVNVNTLDSLEPFSTARRVSYERESPAERIARRRQKWTPAVVTTATGGEAR